MFRHIGEKTIKEIYLKELGSKPMVSEDSIDSLNEIVGKLVSFVLKKAEDYRKLRGLNKRLARVDVELAYKDYLISQK